MRRAAAGATPLSRSDAEALALASQVARLYFDREMTQVQIASRLGISRFRVARLLEYARQQGLVRIEFRDIPSQDPEMARAIEERWGIDLCVVAAGDAHADGIAPSLARLAASVIADLIGSDDVIGVAWGSTLAAVVAELPSRTSPGIHVVQLAGNSGRVERTQNPGELARALADRLGATCHALFAPAFVESPTLRDALLREPEIRATVQLFDRVSLAVVGIGSYAGRKGSNSSLVQARVLDDEDLARLLAEGAIGDLVLYPFDASGRFVADKLADRAMAVSQAQLARIPRVIAVAGGVLKAPAIAAALATGVIKMLVTDAPAAERLLMLGGRPAR